MKRGLSAGTEEAACRECSPRLSSSRMRGLVREAEEEEEEAEAEEEEEELPRAPEEAMRV
jgi:hypothetical protein